MKLIEAAPYIRFADVLKMTNQRGPSKTYDCRLIYALSGKATIAFADHSVELVRCSAVTFQSGTLYTILPSPELTAIVYDFDYTQGYSHITNIQYPCPADRFVPERAFTHVSFSDATAFDNALYLPNIRLIENSLMEIVDEMKQCKPLYQGKCSAIFKSILFDMARHAHLKGNNYKLIDTLIDYIRTITNTGSPMWNVEKLSIKPMLSQPTDGGKFRHIPASICIALPPFHGHQIVADHRFDHRGNC